MYSLANVSIAESKSPVSNHHLDQITWSRSHTMHDNVSKQLHIKFDSLSITTTALGRQFRKNIVMIMGAVVQDRRHDCMYVCLKQSQRISFHIWLYSFIQLIKLITIVYTIFLERNTAYNIPLYFFIGRKNHCTNQIETVFSSLQTRWQTILLCMISSWSLHKASSHPFQRLQNNVDLKQFRNSFCRVS